MIDGNNRVRFAHYEADFRSGEVFKNGIRIPFQEKPFQILSLLLHANGEVVTRDQIYAAVWPDTHVAQSLSLNTAVKKLRTALGDDARNPELIETVRGGYRLLVEVRTVCNYRTGRMRLAVAPFENLGAEEQDYLADGMTEEMIAQLGRAHKDISIIAPFSTLSCRQSAISLADIARSLRADYILTGTVLTTEGRVQVTAKLIRASDQVCLWSASYARPEGDVFAIEDEITNQIADAMVSVLSGGGNRSRALSTEPWTHRKYLKGCFFANKWSEAGFRKAIELFQQTISEDQGFAPAYGALAKLYMGMGAQGILPPAVINERTSAMASKALALCPDLPEALTAQAWSQLFYEGDWRTAERTFLRSIDVNPSATHAYEGYSHLLMAASRTDEAIEVAHRACELDPLSPFAANLLACSYYFARQYETARARMQECIDTHPAFPISHSGMGWIYEALGDMEKAVASQRAAVKHNPGVPVMMADLAHTLGVAGHQDEARELLQKALSARTSIWVPPYVIALAFLGIGEKETALEWLDKGVEEHCGWRIFYGVDPRLEVLASDERFTAILERVGFPQRG